MSKSALVTGSNRGIGLELCRQLKQRGFNVIATCRQSSSALSALGVEVIENVEVSDLKSLASLGAKLAGCRIDWLINNAGIADGIAMEVFDDRAIASCKRMFEVNSLGPLLTVQALLDNLGEGSKIGIISSRMGSVADNDSGGSYGYRMSKAAVNAVGKSLAIDLKPRGIAVGVLHPGWVRTDMTGHNGLIDVDESGKGILIRMDELNINNTGSFWHANSDLLPW
ncbi:MAG: SDR family oxidoreductase [Methyloprofundus sp.]|nr:SDR family oxidoreductase [Methyloprofundus sp.]MBW6453509.1 SDR family oxidoreductase [Methyloprofundus sp.]